MTSRITHWTSLIVVLCAVGCGQPVTVEEIIRGPLIDQGLDVALKQIRADPVAHLRRSLEAANALKTIRMKFHRQERLGVIPELKPAENMLAEYRDKPFSVRFTWLDEGSEYVQCVYIDGKNNNRVALLPRKNIFGGPGTVGNYHTGLGELFHKARNPITDFGPRRMMERLLNRIEKAEAIGGVKIKVLGATRVGPSKEPCYHFEMLFPPADEFACKLTDLFIHTRTDLPVGTRLWLTQTGERSDETLDASYVYSDIEPDALLGDERFVINAKPGKAKRAKTAKLPEGDVPAGTNSSP